MKVTNNNLSLIDFEAWSGAIDTKNTIIEHDKADDFDMLIDDLYPEGITETQLNDILWFEEDWLYQNLGIYTDEEE